MTLGLSIGPRIKIGPTIKLSGFDPDATAWFNVCSNAGSAVNNMDQAAITTFIAGLKTDGLWSICDRLPLFAVASSTQSLIDLKTLTTFTNVNTSTFAAYGGYTGNGTSSYINLNFTPSTANGNYTLNSASFGVYVRTARVGAAEADVGAGQTAFSHLSYIFPRYSDNNCYASINGNAAINDLIGVSPGSSGMWVVSRTTSIVLKAYNAGSQVGSTQTAASSVLSDASFVIGTGGTTTFPGADYSTDQIAGGYVGGALTDTQAANLSTRFQTLAQSMTTAWNV